jgi:hypothetical protein
MGAPQTFKLQAVKGRTFEVHRLYVSGIRFEDCKFIDFMLVYSGGPGEMSGCALYPGINLGV